jgi:hypothetical protein
MTPEVSTTAGSAGAVLAPPENREKISPAAQGDGVRGKTSERRAPAKKKAKAPEKPPKISCQELGRAVAVELSKVRAVLKEVGSGVVDRLDGEAASLALFLDGDCLPGEKALLPSARTLKAMAAAFGGLKVKPKKGRVKDLARIELLLMVLASKMPPGR